MIKVLGLIIIIVSCSSLGIIADYWKKKRVEELNELVKGFEMLKAEIDYRLTPMAEACEYVSRLNHSKISDLFLQYARKLENKESGDAYEMWQSVLEQNKQYLHLEEEEYVVLEEFGEAVGYLDKEMQKRNIDMLLAKLNRIFEKGQEEYAKKGKMYRGLGVLTGIGLSIILI